MTNRSIELLKFKCRQKSYEELMRLNNPKLHNFVARYVELCNPDSVYVCDDSDEDRQYIRNRALSNNEERKLAIDRHTV